MPRGMYKSGRLRKIFVKTPGGESTIHYRQRKPSKAICADCKKQLAGVPRELPGKLTKIPKTARRPDRPYGGVLCSTCMRKKLLQQVREEK
ncbi:50S ribosomal protein L34e [Candidatus Woesearchaeota archaeon]|nr:50S ribosomal protein L34e [Candidatus Woesearchaeota archaeon]